MWHVAMKGRPDSNVHWDNFVEVVNNKRPIARLTVGKLPEQSKCGGQETLLLEAREREYDEAGVSQIEYLPGLKVEYGHK